jgi:hypothetical protein
MKLPGIPRTGKWVTKDDKIEAETDRWLQAVVSSVDAASQQFSSATDSSVGATVAATAFPASTTLAAGMYRVTYAMWVTRAATVSSSLTFTAAWTNNLQSFTQSGSALTGNTLTTQQNGSFVFSIDSSSDVTYQITYASVGATTMTYAYDVRLESLP